MAERFSFTEVGWTNRKPALAFGAKPGSMVLVGNIATMHYLGMEGGGAEGKKAITEWVYDGDSAQREEHSFLLFRNFVLDDSPNVFRFGYRRGQGQIYIWTTPQFTIRTIR